ncbi:MAG: GNAT family N-acetyltransferase [Megasphaera sp.]|jgi:PhnO protein|uniref:GNAT family N-acetyltransferase n=1 Tax=Megasphaera sueciensis TaxID=349094 RepID=UPI003D04759B|nr:GNAT family N-acetyltransferase [Megasphaera sp.]
MYRKSEVKDCKTIYSLICALENRNLSYERFAEIYGKQLLDEQYYCLIYEQNNSIQGMLNLRFEEQLHHAAEIAEILEFIVSENCRGEGIGKRIFQRACEIAKNRGCIQIEVACNQLRKSSHLFYMREGMHNFHFKFSKSLCSEEEGINALGRDFTGEIF